MFNLVQKRRWYFLLSTLVILPGIVAMIYSTIEYGTPVRLGVDFESGSKFVLKLEADASEDAIRAVFEANGFNNPIVTRLGNPADNTWQVRTKFVDADTAESILTQLSEQVAPVDKGASSVDSVSPAISREVTTSAAIAVTIAALVILSFIVWAFRRVPRSFRYGVCAIAAMIHDILVTMGIMSLLGIFFGWEADALFLTAMLTVIGFSVQDTIVVFDRIRENIPRRRGESFETIANRSLLETIHRSLATQLNAIFVMVAILLFGGASIKQFIFILLVGLLSGTYSSIFNAVPLLVAWEEGDFHRWFRFGWARRRATA
jgi:preprotein translocase SecF subunit